MNYLLHKTIPLRRGGPPWKWIEATDRFVGCGKCGFSRSRRGALRNLRRHARKHAAPGELITVRMPV